MNQLRSFLTAAARFRKSLFGTDSDDKPVLIRYNNGEHEVEGYYALREQQARTEQAGWLRIHQAVVRFSKTIPDPADASRTIPLPFTPEMSKSIEFTDDTGTAIRLCIDEIRGQHPTAVEWVLGCNSNN